MVIIKIHDPRIHKNLELSIDEIASMEETNEGFLFKTTEGETYLSKYYYTVVEGK